MSSIGHSICQNICYFLICCRQSSCLIYFFKKQFAFSTLSKTIKSVNEKYISFVPYFLLIKYINACNSVISQQYPVFSCSISFFQGEGLGNILYICSGSQFFLKYPAKCPYSYSSTNKSSPSI